MTSATTDVIGGLGGNLGLKAPVMAVATTALTLSGEQTVSGIPVVAGHRVLATAQSSSVLNGIWVVSTGPWTRAVDFDGSRDVVQGTRVPVATSGVIYRLTTSSPVIGTSALAFTAEATPTDGGEFSAADFGFLPANSAADNATAFADMVTFARELRGNNTIGGCTFYIPPGRYNVAEIDIHEPGELTYNVHFKGDGYGATTLIAKPVGSVTSPFEFIGLTFSSFSDIEFINGAATPPTYLITVASEYPTTFSTFYVTFRRCFFRSSGSTVGRALIWVHSSGWIRFDECEWSSVTGSTDAAVLLGANLADSLGPANWTTFENCTIGGDVLFRRCYNTMFINTAHRPRGDGTPSQIAPNAAGDELQVSTTFINPSMRNPNTTASGTFWTQGNNASSRGLFWRGGWNGHYIRQLNINGGGGVDVAAADMVPAYDAGGTVVPGQIPISIGTSAQHVHIDVDTSWFDAEGIAFISDARTAPPFPAYISLGTDHTFTSSGAFETVLSQSTVKLRGGWYEADWSVSLIAAGTSEYVVRVIVDGVAVGGGVWAGTSVSGNHVHMRGKAVWKNAGTPSGVTVTLDVQQVSAVSYATIQATDINYTTHLIVREIDG